jgi:hypothetical protein
MSKTLFNTNTFQSKTLQNSNTIDIGESNVTNFTATNATITNLTNTELQAATSGVATNTSAIANKQDEITASNRLSATLIGANGNVSNTEYGYLQNVSSDIQDQLTFNAQATTTNTNNIATNTSNIENNTSNIATNTSNIATNTSNIATNTSNIASNTSNIATNTSNIATNTSNIATNTSNIATNTSNIATNATDINTNKTNINGITASGSLTTLTNRLNIQAGGIPQLILDRPSNGDVEIQLVGKRTGSTSSRHTRIDFQNDDSGVTPSVRTMVSVVGRVTNHTTNVGGLEIVNFVDGQTETGALTMSHNGNFNIGGGSAFQDNFKVSINGTLNVESAIYQIPQLVSYNFDKAIVSNDLWGQGNYQTDLDSTRTSGTAFSSHSSGIITFSQTGTYHIKVSGNLQSIRQNDRLAFAIYLVTLDSVNDPITDYFENSNYNFFGWIYSRNTTDGAHGNISFQDHLHITSGQKIVIKNKLDVDGLDFNDTLAEDYLNNYLNITITKISGEDIFNP